MVRRFWPLFLLAIPLALGCPPTSSDDDDDDDDDSSVAGCGVNEWPASTAPENYAGTGSRTGDLAMDFEALDQNGECTTLTQFHGSMVLIDFSAMWCEPCNEAAAHAQDFQDEMNADQSRYDFWYVHVLVDDANADGGPATVDNAATWAATYGLEFPVVVGDAANEWATPFFGGPFGLPAFAILDPSLEIREFWQGERSTADIRENLDTYYDEWLAEQ